MELEKITLSLDRTHHLCNGEPFYNRRFLSVEKFHNPGLAPVIEESGAYHIKSNGEEAYSNRFSQTFGFYCGLAVVEQNGKWFHILPDGTRSYENNFDWLGNFQEDICVAKKNSKFFHIKRDGEALYEERYNYVGDFKDGVAVVHLNGKATHITQNGNFLHNKWFKNLDIFHKGYARAEDEDGWFHIDLKGNELYQERYKNIEVYYNKLAVVETFDGHIKQINLKNQTIYEIREKSDQKIIGELFGDLVGFWKTKLIATAVKLNLLEFLPNNIPEIALKLKIPSKNLFRLLRALWELDILKYDHINDTWGLGNKGKILKTQQYKFLQDAAILWNKVSELDWNQLPKLLSQEEIKCFKSFKDTERNPIYQKAVDGYLRLDLEKILNAISGRDRNILCIGRSAELLANELESVDYITSLDKLIENTKKYTSAILLKFIHYFDDTKADQIIDLLNKSNVIEIYIIEMLVSKESSTGGILDMNMIIECGGKLRNMLEFTLLLNRHNYKVIEVKNINPYLQVIYARR